MSGETDALADKLEGFRSYLLMLARLHLDPRLRSKVDLSGVVQQTLWEGQRALARSSAPGGTELVALRRLLANNLADEVRKCYADKREVDRERSLDAAMQQSSARLEAFLAVEQSSPEQRAGRNEELLRLAEALERLPEAQRQAVELHYLRGWRLEEIAQCMDRGKSAVAGLLHRGLDKLREFLQPSEQNEP